MIENYIYLVGQFINTVGKIVLFSSILFFWILFQREELEGYLII